MDYLRAIGLCLSGALAIVPFTIYLVASGLGLAASACVLRPYFKKGNRNVRWTKNSKQA